MSIVADGGCYSHMLTLNKACSHTSAPRTWLVGPSGSLFLAQPLIKLLKVHQFAKGFIALGGDGGLAYDPAVSGH